MKTKLKEWLEKFFDAEYPDIFRTQPLFVNGHLVPGDYEIRKALEKLGHSGIDYTAPPLPQFVGAGGEFGGAGITIPWQDAAKIADARSTNEPISLDEIALDDIINAIRRQEAATQLPAQTLAQASAPQMEMAIQKPVVAPTPAPPAPALAPTPAPPLAPTPGPTNPMPSVSNIVPQIQLVPAHAPSVDSIRLIAEQLASTAAPTVPPMLTEQLVPIRGERAKISVAPLPQPITPETMRRYPLDPRDVVEGALALPIPDPNVADAEALRFELPGGHIEIPGGDSALARIRAQARDWLAGQQRKSAPPPLGVVSAPHPWSPGARIIAHDAAMLWPELDIAEQREIEREILRNALDRMRQKHSEDEVVKPLKMSDYNTLQRQAFNSARIAIKAGASKDAVIAQIAPTIARMNEIAQEHGAPTYDPEMFYDGVKAMMEKDMSANEMLMSMLGASSGPVQTKPDVGKILSDLGLQ